MQESTTGGALSFGDDISRFTRSVFASLPRVDQRRWAEIYLRGILSVEGKKSIRNIVDAVAGDPAATQSLQQFVNQSPWDSRPVRASLARYVQQLVMPRAWIVEHSVIPKRGDHSVGVERRFVRKNGRTVNCQLGVGLFATSEAASLPIDWRLHLSNRWLEDSERRSRTRIPRCERARSETDLVLDMVDGLTADWGITPVPSVVAGVQPGDALSLIEGLVRRSIGFLLEIEGDVGALWGSRMPVGAVTLPRLPARVGSAVAHGRLGDGGSSQQHGTVIRRFGDEAVSGGYHLTSTAIRLPRLAVPQMDTPTLRLIEQHMPGCQKNSFWVTNLAGSGINDMHSLAMLRRRSEASLRTMEVQFGLHDFEGRSFPGWHHHLTLVSAAAIYKAMRDMSSHSYETSSSTGGRR